MAQCDEPLAQRSEFSQKPGASAFFHVTGELLHGLRCDDAAFATDDGSTGIIEREKKFGALPLAFSRTASCSERSRPLSIARRAKAF